MCDVGNGVACARVQVQVQVPCLHLRAINWIYAACVRACGARSSFAWAFHYLPCQNGVCITI